MFIAAITFLMRSGEFINEFFYFGIARIGKAPVPAYPYKPAFLQHFLRSEIIKCGTSENGPHFFFRQKNAERGGCNSLVPEFPVDPIGDLSISFHFKFRDAACNIITEDYGHHVYGGIL